MRLTDEPPTASSPTDHTAAEGSRTIRLRHEKRGPLVLLSHLELISIFSRAVARGGVPIRFSQGFHPHPRFSFATALSVGIDSTAEYFDMEIEPTMSAEEAMAALNGVLPVGLKILEAREMPPKSPSLSTLMEGIRYRLTFPTPLDEGLPSAVGRFLALEDYPLIRKRKKGDLFLDLRQELLEASVEGNLLSILVRRGKPLEFAAAITGLSIQELEAVAILKSDVIFAASPQLQSGDETVS
jgi:radical SAM-linked protein